MSQYPEKIKTGPENKIESYDIAAEQFERIGKEKSAETLSDQNEVGAESARAKALETAISAESQNKEAETAKDTAPFKKIEPINKKYLDESYKRTMKQTQKELTPSSRAFSKLIHNKTVEKVSGAIGSTIARPNAILSGSFVAFILTLSVYLIAKSLGYRLSGSESIFAFIIGWVIGILFDYLRVMTTGKK